MDFFLKKFIMIMKDIFDFFILFNYNDYYIFLLELVYDIFVVVFSVEICEVLRVDFWVVVEVWV